MSYVNLNNPANFQLQEFEQLGFRYIVSGRPTIGGETYRTIFVLTDAVVTATCPNGDSLSSETLVAGTVIHGFFEDVSVASGSLLAYKAGPITAQEIFDAYKAYVYAQGGIVEGESCAVADIAALLEDKLYSAASLVLIPSGYKVSHLYAERPLDSNGDFTFTRASSATRVGPNGLIEKVRTNLALYSQDLSQTGTWFTSATTRVDSQTDPNGGTTASKFTATGANSNVIQTLTVSSGIPYTWSFYAKSDSATDVNIRLDNNNGNFVQANMALTTSWQRFSITLNSNATTILCFLGGGLSFTTGEVAYMAFAQLESGDIMTDYIATTSAAVSVGPVANLPRIDYTGGGCGKLLLEPQRTNNAQFSEQFDNAYWSKSNATVTSTLGGPIDQSKYFTITCNATTGIFKGIKKDWINAAPNTYTLSVFAKSGTSSTFVVSSRATLTSNDTRAIFNLANGTITNVNGGTATIVPYADGWYRCSFTVVNSGTYSDQASMFFGHPHGAADGATVLATGAMSEIGAYPTSYVNTLGASVTRLVDACSKTGISSLIGQTEGTLFFEGSAIANESTNKRISLSDGTNANRVTLSFGLDAITFVVVVSNVASVSTGHTINPSTNHKIAFAYKQNDFVVYIDGVQVLTDTSGNVFSGALDSFNFSDGQAGLSRFSGDTKQALVFKTRLTNAQLAALTTL